MKTRIIHTRFWQDGMVLELTPHAKLLFMYVLSNERLGLTGGYECPDKIIELETGLGGDELEQAKSLLKSKILFENGWIGIKNACKYNNYSVNKIHKASYKQELQNLPVNIKNFTLVRDYSPTSPRLDKNKKQEIRNKNNKIINKNRGIVKGDKKNNTNFFFNFNLISYKEKYPKLDIQEEYEKASDWLKMNGKTYKDYSAFFNNWCRRSKNYNTNLSILNKFKKNYGKF